ncbi:MAG TPA: tail fiber domain-containing protein [Clostridiales bacterium]|nr:tail fiber domain-containing protein [Clostridiales bacterium]
MKKLFSFIMVIFTALLWAETLFEVKDASNNKVLDISTDGLRVLNGGDTLMVISTDGIRAYIQNDATKGLSRSFSVTTSASKGEKSQSKVFEVATDEGAIFYNPSDNSDEIFSIKKDGITANVNPGTGRDFEVNDQISSAKSGGGNLMKVSNSENFETVNDSTMLWYKQKNAFRVGHVLITDPNNVGQASFASGYQSQASGKYSTAIGYKSEAKGANSFAAGDSVIASSENSSAIGNGSIASGLNSIAAGCFAEARGNNSCAFGVATYATEQASVSIGGVSRAVALGAVTFGMFNEAWGEYSSALGTYAYASGNYSTAMGFGSKSLANFSSVMGSYSKTRGTYSTATGNNTTALSYNSFVTGRYNKIEGDSTAWISTDPLFVVGNGASSSLRSNAFEVKKNGHTFIVGSTTLGSLMIAPNEAASGDDAEIILAEDNDGTYNMSMKYDGGDNRLEWWAEDDAGTYGPLMYLGYNPIGGGIPYLSTGFVRPISDNTFDLGTSTLRWDDIYATNGVIQTSDKRQKSDVKDMEYGLGTLMKMRPVTYYWKDKAERGRKVGLIAQDLLDIVPEVVNIGEDENKTLGINYAELTPVLIKAVQDQQKEIVSQNERISRLEEMIEKFLK